MAVHLSTRAGAALHPSRIPPRTRLEETVIDLWQTALTLDDAVGWVTSAVGRRLTTQDKLREAMEGRARLRWRTEIAELLSPDAAGIHSVLEYRYVRGVERPHGLAGAKRQARARRNGRNEYRDQLYEDYGMAVELDGRLAHPGDTRWDDIRRDNAAAAMGVTTLRYSWRDVTATPCRVAAEIAEVLAARGYTRARRCSASCPVRQSQAARTVRAGRPSQLTAATCRLTVRTSADRKASTGSKLARDRPRARMRSTRTGPP